MAGAVRESAIARDHDAGGRDGAVHHFLGVGEEDDASALLAIAGEGFGGEALAGVGPQQVWVVDAHALLPAGFEERRIEAGGTPHVRINLRPGVAAPGAGARGPAGG